MAQPQQQSRASGRRLGRGIGGPGGGTGAACPAGPAAVQQRDRVGRRRGDFAVYRVVDGRAVCEGEDGDGRAGIMIPEMTRIERAWGKRGGGTKPNPLG